MLFSQFLFSPNQRYFVPDHWHEDLEYFYVIEGELKFHVNGQTIILHAKEGILVNSKRIHSNQSLPGKSCVYYCAIVHPCLLCSTKYIEQTYVQPVISPSSFDYLLLSHDDWTSQIIKELVRIFETPGFDNIELECLEALIRILNILYSHLEKTTLPSPLLHPRPILLNQCSFTFRNIIPKKSLLKKLPMLEMLERRFVQDCLKNIRPELPVNTSSAIVSKRVLNY